MFIQFIHTKSIIPQIRKPTILVILMTALGLNVSSADAFSLVSTTTKTTAISKEINTAGIVTVDKNISLFDPASVFKPEPKSIAVKGTLGIRTPWQTAQGDRFIELAERKVYLRDLLAGSDVDGQLTQLDGKFDLKVPKPGRYAICWSVENISQTCGKYFSVEKEPIYLGEVTVYTEIPFVWGLSLMREERPCWLHDPYFEVDLFTRVELLDTAFNPVASAVKANVSGEYVMGVPKGKRYMLRSSCEKAVYQSQFVVGASWNNVNLPLPNWIPKEEEFAAYLAGRGVVSSPAGETLKVNFDASDKDGHPLKYVWKTLEGSGDVAGSNSAHEEWKLPNTPGRHQVYAMARDGHGGYLIKGLPMQVGVPLAQFSGTVIDEVTRAPIKNAAITMLGAATVTDASGWFSLEVPEITNNPRYSLNINHFSYATASRVHDKSSHGATYELIQAQITQHDPASPIDIVDTTSSGPCGRGNPDNIDPTGKDRRDQINPKKVDPKQHLRVLETLAKRGVKVVTPDEKCEHRGARLQLPARALVYADQSPAAGPISLSMATINPARRAMVGDYRAIDAKNQDMELTSFGALFAEFRDKYGKKINVKKGMEAELTIPISNDLAPDAKSQIDMWSYDEKSGFWLQEQVGKLVNTASGPAYTGPTRHFSTINMDVAGNDPANATCVRFEVGASLSAWNNLVMRAYVPVNGTGVQVKETSLDNAQYHAVYRIPYSAPPAGNTLRVELRGTLPSGEQVVLLEEIIATDLRPKMTGTSLWPAYPYTECGTPIVLEADPVVLPYYGDIAATGRPAFLTGPYGTYLPINGQQTSDDYYAAVDPIPSQRLFLEDWWLKNGFGADGSGGTRASYMNHNDLGFGRDMHCLGDATNYACYVTNYGLPNQSSANADDAVNQNLATQGATVTMEYDATLGDTAVSFFAYNGGTGVAPRINFADLDGLGPKPIPHLCMVCHGGTPSDFNIDNKVHDAVFREFDMPSLKYSGNRSWDFAPAPNTLTPSELANFAVLNDEVAAINSGGKIEDLITDWYNGGGNIPQQLSNAEVPASWSGQENTYRDVYAKACRTCHISRPGIVDSFGSFSFSDYTVCNSPKIMPNAFITYKNFWSDLILVDLYETATGASNCFD